MLVSGSYLYGTTYAGGSSDSGTLFRLTATGEFTSLLSFDGLNGAAPQAGLTSSGSRLYGTTGYGGGEGRGSIFEYEPVENVLTQVSLLSVLPPNYPDSPLTPTPYGLFGTSSNGHIYSYDPVANTVALKVSFADPAPWDPKGPLTSDGMALFGVNRQGGMADAGAVFKIDLASGAQSNAQFNSASGGRPTSGLVMSGGYLYGAGGYAGPGILGGMIFKVDPATLEITRLATIRGNCYFDCLINPLVEVGGVLYGTMLDGGGDRQGSAFRVEVTPSVTVTEFGATGRTGRYPTGALVPLSGYLYGTTSLGGDYDCGTLFRLTPSIPDSWTTLYSFSCDANGGEPNGLALNGTALVGTAGCCGSGWDGTVFEFDGTNSVIPLFSFDRTIPSAYHPAYSPANTTALSGYRPLAPVISSGSLLYGTTREGGAGSRQGSVFTLSSTGTHTTLFAFDGTNGSLPEAPLINVGGYFYGTTTKGEHGGGTVFSTNVRPTITVAGPLTRAPGGPATACTIATVGDYEDAADAVTITVDSPPAGLSVSSISNSGGTISAVVQASASMAEGSYDLYLTARDTALGSRISAPLTVNVVTGEFDVPGNFTATASGPAAVTLQWNAVTNATSYELLRDGQSIGAPTGLTFIDTEAGTNAGHVYKMRAVTPTFHTLYAADVATTVPFANDPLSSGLPISMAHIQQLRTITNALRVVEAMPVFVFTDQPLTTAIPIRAAHMMELRTALEQLRGTLGLPAIMWTDQPIAPQATVIKAVHVQEIRDGLK